MLRVLDRCIDWDDLAEERDQRKARPAWSPGPLFVLSCF